MVVKNLSSAVSCFQLACRVPTVVFVFCTLVSAVCMLYSCCIYVLVYVACGSVFCFYGSVDLVCHYDQLTYRNIDRVVYI